MREIKLILKGQPMSKQSVRGGKYGFYQDKKYKVREEDYRRQIKEQLPSDFVMFEKMVWVSSAVFVHYPIQRLRSSKRKIAELEGGLLIPKPTKPDLSDNLMKLVLDSMSRKAIRVGKKVVGYEQGVYVDDALIVALDGLRKYWGFDPRIEITLIGE